MQDTNSNYGDSILAKFNSFRSYGSYNGQSLQQGHATPRHAPDDDIFNNDNTAGPLIIESSRAKKRVSTGALRALDDPLVVQTKI